MPGARGATNMPGEADAGLAAECLALPTLPPPLPAPPLSSPSLPSPSSSSSCGPAPVYHISMVQTFQWTEPNTGYAQIIAVCNKNSIRAASHSRTCASYHAGCSQQAQDTDPKCRCTDASIAPHCTSRHGKTLALRKESCASVNLFALNQVDRYIMLSW